MRQALVVTAALLISAALAQDPALRYNNLLRGESGFIAFDCEESVGRPDVACYEGTGTSRLAKLQVERAVRRADGDWATTWRRVNDEMVRRVLVWDGSHHIVVLLDTDVAPVLILMPGS